MLMESDRVVPARSSSRSGGAGWRPTGRPNLHGSRRPTSFSSRWDGTQRAHLLELYNDGKLPNLASLAREGTFFPMAIADHATDTKAGHSEMLTGYGPDVTGVTSNGRFRAIPTGLTLFERLKSEFGRRGISTAAITGKYANLAEILKNALPAIDKASIKQAEADEVGAQALQVLEAFRDRPFFAFFHFADPDHAGHGYGENSTQYSQAIETCDHWLGEIVAKLKALGLDGADRGLRHDGSRLRRGREDPRPCGRDVVRHE